MSAQQEPQEHPEQAAESTEQETAQEVEQAPEEALSDETAAEPTAEQAGATSTETGDTADLSDTHESGHGSDEEPAEEAEEGYDEVRTDSLVMFGAALGGAILGMLLTMLMLAIVNGGTLNFARSADKVESLEATLARVNENVGAVSSNVDAVAARTDALAGQLAAVEAATQAELTAQADEIADINDAVSSLDTTREQFDVFMGALSTALDDVNAVSEESSPETDTETESPAADEPADEAEDEPAAEESEPASEEAAAEETDDLPLPSVQSSADLGPNDVQVILFTDADSNGMMADDETSLVGINVSLVDSNGEAVADAVTGDEGALFEELEAGEYDLVVDETLGYELLSQGNASLVVGENGEGMVILIPVATTAD